MLLNESMEHYKMIFSSYILNTRNIMKDAVKKQKTVCKTK